MIEEWAIVEDAPNYAVSNYGRVVNRRTDRILKQEITNGYFRVKLNERSFRVHRLVAEYFCEGYASYLDVNHLDGDKLNNLCTNLEWTTRKENIRHAFRTGLSVSGKRTPIRIVETGEVFLSQSHCAEAIGGKQPSINAVLKESCAAIEVTRLSMLTKNQCLVIEGTKYMDYSRIPEDLL